MLTLTPTRFVILGAIVALGACDAPSGPGAPAAPIRMRDLEPVDYDLLDGATILFQRIDVYPEGGRDGFYVVDGAARQSRPGWRTLRDGPALSPDGEWVAFRAPPSGFETTFWDIAVARVDSLAFTHVVRLAGNAEGSVTWTPDGRLLYGVYEGQQSDGARTAFFTKAPTLAATPQLVHRFVWLAEQSLTCPWYDVGYAEPPSVAPDGDLAFMCNWRALQVRDSETGGVRTLYEIPAPNDGTRRLLYAPAYSPDGSRIFLVEAPQYVRPDSVGIQLRVVNADGSDMRVLATLPYGEWHEYFGSNNVSACWLSASRIVVSLPTARLRSHLYVVNAAGGDPARLTTKPDAYDRSVSCAR